MVDTVVTTAAPSSQSTSVTTASNINDDWEVAVDTGEFDKRLEQQEKSRATNQETVVSSSTVNEDENQNSSMFNLMKLNKPIRILKRPTSQSQLLNSNDANSSSTGMMNNNSNNSTSSTNPNASTSSTVPVISIIPRNAGKDANNGSSSNVPTFANNSTKPPIKTYEQREAEYRLARLRIMGEEESSAKDDDDDENPTNANLSSVETSSNPLDDSTRSTVPSSLSNLPSTRTTNKLPGLSHPPAGPAPLHCHPNANSYPSNLYALNNVPSNSGTIHFTPHNSSTPNIGAGPYSAPNFSPHFRGPYSGPYSHMPPPPPPPSVPRYPITVPTTTTPLYMTPTAPFVTAPPSSSGSTTISPSYPYSAQPHPTMNTNSWYPYPPQQQAPYGTQQYGHPQ